MICFNANQIYFHFDNRITICAENTFFHQPANTDFSVMVHVPTGNSNLLTLIEHHVAEAHVCDGDMLILKFDDAQKLRFEAGDTFESYRVTVGENEIII